MIIGKKSRFAIEWEFAADPVGMFLQGRVCFWVGGVRVGNYELDTTLSDVLINLAHLVGDCGKRQSHRLRHLSPADAFSTLQRGLFDSDPLLSLVVEEEQWARFDISIPVDVFDDWRMYLIDCGSQSRLLVSHKRGDSHTFVLLLEQLLSPGEFDRVITEFQSNLEATWEQHRYDPI